MVLALATVGSAFAQVPSGEQTCINEINKNARKVLLTENQTIAVCARSLVKGTLAAPTVAQCATPAVSSKVQKAMSKAIADSSKRCPGGPPSFGPPSTATFPLLAVQAGAATLGDVFGPNVESALLTDGAGSKCQDWVLKAVHKCEDTRVKQFLSCKKAGMKSGAITDAASLRDRCLGTSPEQPDPKARIAIACQYKLEESIQAKCLDEGVAIAQAFPACATASRSALADCLDSRAACRTCVLLNGVDGLTKDCDVADDGNDANQSCPEPTTCGDLYVDGLENCEDGDAQSGDGCSAACRIEPGWLCSGHPSVCTPICGDGIKVSAEACDDGDLTSGDGCSATCKVETGYSCSGSPSVCNPVCGDGRILGGEGCDDGNRTIGDGCSSVCEIEGGYSCSGQPSVCQRFEVTITSPTHGSFSTSSTATVTGFISNLSPALAALTINGIPVPVAANGTFSTVLSMSSSAIFNPIEATLVDIVHGGIAHHRVVRIRGSSVADGAFSSQSVALRLNDSGLDKVEPLVASMAGSGLNLAQLVPVGTYLINNECFIDTPFGCAGSATVRVSTPAPSIGGFSLAADSMTNFVAGDITVSDIEVNVFLDGSGLVPNCPITITANHAFFFGDYALQPDAAIPSNIDVNQLGALQVSFSNFTVSYGGLCDAPIIGDIIQAFLPDVEALTIDAMADFLDDPDGSGPQDSPTAEAIEDALAGISITGPIGEGLGVLLETPLFAVNEDNVGITLGSNSRITTSFGGGPGQCVPPPGAPNLTASLAFAEVFPSFGANSPALNRPYDVAISISAEGFNQLLKAQTECGLLVTSIDVIDIGLGPLPITAGILSVLMPEFGVYPSNTPFRIDIRPSLAPIVTGAAGPGGELTELRVSNVLGLLVRDDGSEEIALAMAFDASMGMNLTFTPGALGVTLTPPNPNSIVIAIIDNPLDVNEATLEMDILPPLLGSLLPDLSSSLSSFPLPDFLGLSLNGVEVSRTGLFLSLYSRLQPVP